MLYHVSKYMTKWLSISTIAIMAVLLLGPIHCQAQSDSNKTAIDTNNLKASEFKRKANQQNRNGDIYNAIESYEIYLSIEPNDTKIAFKLANLYLNTRNYKPAKSLYDKVLTYDEKKYPEAMYYAGIVSQNLESYNEAIVYFTTFRRAFRGHKDPNKLRKQAQSHIKSCEWALENKDEESNISVQLLSNSINQPHIEFSPFPISKDEMLFGSLRPDPAKPSVEIRQLYLARQNNSVWNFESTLNKNINIPYTHTGNAALSADGQRMYFTRCEKNWQQKTICSIWLSEKEDDEWQKPTKLPYPVNSDNYTTTQPAIGKSQRTGKDVIYFVSDRKGTRGGLDVWYTEINKSDGKYKEPRNLGRNINSPSNDCTPFYDLTSSTLYFSSTGKNGFGGFDIYKTTGSGKKWTEAEHLPKPINTSFDDYYYTTLPNGNEGFFTSNRPGTSTMINGNCCDDIFHFRFNECVKIQAEGIIINQTNYDIYDDLNERYNLKLDYPEDNLPMADVPIDVYLKNENDEQVLYTQTKSDSKGKYSLNLDVDKNYVIIVKNYGFFDKKRSLTASPDNCFDTIKIGTTRINYLPEITVRVNVYYDHNKSRLSTQATSTIDSLLPLFDLFPNAVIEIGSHTDNTGADNYNIKLSQRRSESVVGYLLKKGIIKNRLVAKGYGESQPIVPNTNPDGSDNPENRQLNRRTELKIVGVIDDFDMDE